MIATILEPGNQVIDWSSRNQTRMTVQGFLFPLYLLPARPVSRRFMLPLPLLQPCYRGTQKHNAMAQ